MLNLDMEPTRIHLQKSILDIDYLLLPFLYLSSFLIPLLIPQPQLIVGSAINFLIVFSSLKYGFKQSIPLLIIPSLVATGTGLLFGSATLFLLYLMPFIIISNVLLSLSVSKFKNVIGGVLGILFKVGFLYTSTLILIELIGLPSIFLTSMGYMQIITAGIGSSIAILLYLYTKGK